MAVNITDVNFDDIVMNSEVTVLLDFWAVWCRPCQLLGASIDKLAENYRGKLLVGKINVDEEPELTQRFRVASIPSVYIMQEGVVVERMVGAMPYGDLAKTLAVYIDD